MKQVLRLLKEEHLSSRYLFSYKFNHSELLMYQDLKPPRDVPNITT